MCVVPSKYPVCTPDEVCRALKKAGFSLVKQTGSHAKYSNGIRIVIVPIHNKDLKTGTLKSILVQSNIPLEVFLGLL